MRVICGMVTKIPEQIRCFDGRTDAQNAQPIFATMKNTEDKNMSSATLRGKCWFCGRVFVIRDGRAWKFLCRSCFAFVYEAIGIVERPIDLRHNWDRIMTNYYETKSHYYHPYIISQLNLDKTSKE